MLINFALECVGTVVSSDKVSADGHECTNLISSDWHARRRGFIAEHFIKPPVNITFQFPCSIQIHQVFVTPYVGQQLSSNVEIYSASSKSQTTHQNHKQKAQSELVHSETKTNSSSDLAVIKSDHDSTNLTSPPLFYQVSKVLVPDHGRVCFTNPKSNPRTQSSGFTEDGSLCPYRKTMQHFRREILMCSSHLSVRLVQTRHGSSVAVSSIDIWGLPVMSVPSSVRDSITAKFTNFVRPRPSSIKQVTDDSKPLEREIAIEQELLIPEEFSDPLTCEVMAIPMLLPCGKNVDLSTLDRFFSSEAAHGRAPRDPFTGVVFSENSKPITNIALKSRIDQFLLKHSNDKATSTVARTVKGKSGADLLGKRDVNGQRLHGSISSLVTPSKNSIRTSALPMATSTSHHVPINHSLHVPTSLMKNKEGLQNLFKSPITKASTATTSFGTSSQGETKSHEQKLKDSLNSALSSLLGVSSSKVVVESASAVVSKTLQCLLCKIQLSECDTVYNALCNHTICRQCLTTQFHSSSVCIKCGFCGTPCKRGDFIRKHNM